MDAIFRLMGSVLLIHGLASDEGKSSQLLLVAGGLTLLLAIHWRPERRHTRLSP
jgi:hypothetical protein